MGNFKYKIQNINANLAKIRDLECIKEVCRENGKPYAKFKDEYTWGNTDIMPGDYICQLSNGMWQRFGKDSINFKITQQNESGYSL